MALSWSNEGRTLIDRGFTTKGFRIMVKLVGLAFCLLFAACLLSGLEGRANYSVLSSEQLADRGSYPIVRQCPAATCYSPFTAYVQCTGVGGRCTECVKSNGVIDMYTPLDMASARCNIGAQTGYYFSGGMPDCTSDQSDETCVANAGGGFQCGKFVGNGNPCYDNAGDEPTTPKAR